MSCRAESILPCLNRTYAKLSSCKGVLVPFLQRKLIFNRSHTKIVVRSPSLILKQKNITQRTIKLSP